MSEEKIKVYSVIVWLILALFAQCFSADQRDIEKRMVLKSGRGISLGVVITNPEAEDLQKNKLEGGALVKKVLDDSEAERIGIEEGDIIVRFAAKFGVPGQALQSE